MAAWVALQVARRASPDDLVVVLLPDTGERYLSKVHNDAWMRDNHLLDPASVRVRDVIGSKTRALPGLVSVEAGEPLKRAIALIQQYDVSHIPVFRDQEPVGTLHEADILKTALADPRAVEYPVDQWMHEPLPVVTPDEPVDRVARLMAARTPAVLVRDGAFVGILTRFDMLQFIAGGE